MSRMISTCPNYLHADVSDGGDLSLHQQEVTGRQLVTMSLVPSTVDSDFLLHNQEILVTWQDLLHDAPTSA